LCVFVSTVLDFHLYGGRSRTVNAGRRVGAHRAAAGETSCPSPAESLWRKWFMARACSLPLGARATCALVSTVLD
jgi:hypothetical protein